MITWLRTNPTPDSAVFWSMPAGTSGILAAGAQPEQQHRRQRGEDVDRGGLVEAERSRPPVGDVANGRNVYAEQAHSSPVGMVPRGRKPGAANCKLTYLVSQNSSTRCAPTSVKPNHGNTIHETWRNNTSAPRIKPRRTT